MLAARHDPPQAHYGQFAILVLAKLVPPLYYRHMSDIGNYLRELRTAKRLSLREAASEAGLSNAYLSQIETGTRGAPHPKHLRGLARVYGVPVRDLLRRAGYMDEPAPEETEEEEVNRAFEYVMADARFKAGTRVKGGLDTEAKRYIVEVYERVTGAKLLGLK